MKFSYSDAATILPLRKLPTTAPLTIGGSAHPVGTAAAALESWIGVGLM